MNIASTYAKADTLLTDLRELLPMKREFLDKYWHKLRIEWNFNSNHIEGNTLTYGETELLLKFGRTSGDHTKREYDEMGAHDTAVSVIRNWAKEDREITESDIRDLNRIILVKPYWKDALTYDGQPTRREVLVGEYKQQPNSVKLANGEMFHYSSPEDVPAQMQELFKWYRESDQHPIEQAADFHYQFIRIHPFDDGNGRIARLLVNYTLMKHGYQPLIIKSKEKNQYLAALQKADTGDLNAFRVFIAQHVIQAIDLAIRAAKGEDIEEQDDFKKEIQLLKRKASIKGVSKSPKYIYAAYKSIEARIWNPLQEILEQSAELFSDQKLNRLVNGYLEEIYPRESLMPDLTFTRPTKPEELSIFGHEIYTLSFSSISWNHTLYGLRGAVHTLSNLEVVLKVKLSEESYSISGTIGSKNVTEIECLYGKAPSVSDADEFVKKVKNSLLTEIRKNLPN